MSLKITQAGKGIYIPVRVVTRSKKSGIEITGDLIKVKVKSPPFDGRANEELIELLSEFFSVPISRVNISKGLKSKNKTVFIEGLTADSIESSL